MPQNVKDWVMSPGRCKGEGASLGQEEFATLAGTGLAQGAFASFGGGGFSSTHSRFRSRSSSPVTVNSSGSASILT